MVNSPFSQLLSELRSLNVFLLRLPARLERLKVLAEKEGKVKEVAALAKVFEGLNELDLEKVFPPEQSKTLNNVKTEKNKKST